MPCPRLRCRLGDVPWQTPPIQKESEELKMAKHLGCADSNCGYYWQDVGEDYPSCHFEGFGKAPCEEDDWDANPVESEDCE